MRKLAIVLSGLLVIGAIAGASVLRGASQNLRDSVAINKGVSPPQTQGMSQSPGAPAPSSAGEKASAPAAVSGSDDASIIDRMVIYTANLTLVMKSVQDGMSSVTELAKRLGGAVMGTSTSYQNGEMLATVTLKVPSIAYIEAMDGLRHLGLRVENENSSGRDVSEEYTDLESRLRNLEATEMQFLELMKKASTIDEILKVQQRLTDIRGQIERAKGRMNYLQRSSDTATITVAMVPEGFSKAKPVSGWDPERAARESWEASLRVVQGIALAAIRVAVFSWWLVPPVALLAVALALFRGRRGVYQGGQT